MSAVFAPDAVPSFLFDAVKLQLAGYTIKDIIYAGGETAVAEAESSDGVHVVLKYPESELPPPEQSARWRHEYAVLQSIHSDWVIRPHGLHEQGHRLVLAMEHFSTVSLAQLIDRQQLDLAERLALAQQLSQALSSVHQHGLIHGDIAPKNVLVDLASMRIKLCDFALSTRLSLEQRHHSDTALRGTLEYLSPERTGRTNLEVDYRSDFYSLGVSLYELFSGHLPFEQQDASALLHAQIALMPTPLHALDARIPAALSDIVQKLLAKHPDDRYQSSHGLLHDLRRCAEQWRAYARIEPFPLGQADVPERFCIAQKLYGREAETRQILDSFEHASTGHAELLLIAGYSGIGKTALVNELHKPILARRGYFLRGKCDQYSRNKPYAALSQAFTQLMQQLVVEGEERRQYWRAVLGTRLGDNAAAIAALIPNLELLLGSMPPLVALPAAESEKRLHIVFSHFVQALASRAHPLMLFLDDLQWADAPSLRLLQHLLTDDEGGAALLVVGAYRDNEVQADHPLSQLIEQLGRTSQQAVQTLQLKDLRLQHVTALVADTLQCPQDRAEPLASLCLEKTEGNPFFLGQFLRSLQRQGDLHYEHSMGRWDWNLDQIRQRSMTDNVVTLMLDRLGSLPAGTQTLMAQAATLGESFSMRELVALSGQPVDATLQLLQPALTASLILPLNEDYKFEQTPELLLASRYRFLHDRVQQAAHELIPAQALAAHRLHCGRSLLASSRQQDSALGDRLFTILDCLNEAADLISSPEEREQLLELNLQGGSRAKSASAYGTAVTQLRQAASLMAADDWQRHAQRSLRLYRELAEAEYLAGNFDAAEALYPLAMAACQDRLGQVTICLVQAEQYHIQGRFADAFPVLLQALALLGRPFPDTEEAAQALFPQEFADTEALFLEKPPLSLLEAADMRSEQELLAMRVFHALSYASYQTGRFGAFVLNACRMVQTTLREGQCELSCVALVAYVTAMSAMRKPYAECYQIGRLAMTLAEQRDSPYFRITVYQYFSTFYQHWGDPLAETLEHIDRGLELGQSGINPLSAGYCALLGQVNRLALGTPLDELEQCCERGLRFLAKTHQPNTEAMLKHGVLQPVLALRGKTLSPLSFDTTDTRTSELLADPASPPIVLALCSAAMLRHAYLLDDAVGWRACVDKLGLIGMCLPDSPSLVEAGFYVALGGLKPGFVSADDLPAREAAQAGAREQLARLEQWAGSCETNFRHKQLILAAELARVDGQDKAAMDLYAQAIDAAAAAGFSVCEALANELYARFWTGLHQKQLGSNFIREAHYHYRRWGAIVKCRQLEARWPHVSFSSTRGASSTPASGLSQRSSLTQIGALDMHSLFKANQLLAQELHLETLLPQMLGVLLENAGAERGAIVLNHEGRLFVEIVGGHESGRGLQSERIGRPLPELGDQGAALLPEGLIEFTQLTRDTLALNRPAEDPRFAHCAYLREHRPKSVICLPILSQGRLVALVYLENRQLEDAFTPQRQQTLELLSTQAAISLVHARLYENLETMVEKRTQELRQMSMKDGLTGIANRRAFDERLLIEWRRCQRHQQPISLLMIDIDHFKQYNDHFGHLEGDRCIKAVAQALQEQASRSSDLLARYGGEEFALLLPDTSATAADSLAESCLNAIDALDITHPSSPVATHVCLSIGCATLLPSNDGGTELSPEQLLSLADQALYRAKRQGRHRWCRQDH